MKIKRKRPKFFASYPHEDLPGHTVFVRNHGAFNALLGPTLEGKRRYLASPPQPNADGQVRWVCAVCAIEYALGGRRPVFGPVTVITHPTRTRYLPLPMCDRHSRRCSVEAYNSAVLLAALEAEFEKSGGAPVTLAIDLSDDAEEGKPSSGSPQWAN
jgi:hypothetical protein